MLEMKGAVYIVISTQPSNIESSSTAVVFEKKLPPTPQAFSIVANHSVAHHHYHDLPVQSPHPAAHPATSSTPTSLSSTNAPNPSQCSAITHASKCLQAGTPSPRVSPPNRHPVSPLAPSFPMATFPLDSSNGASAGNAANAKAGHEQFHAVRWTS